MTMSQHPSHGTFQRKFRSMWFGKKKQQCSLENNSQLKSNSSSSLDTTASAVGHQLSNNSVSDLLPLSLRHRSLHEFTDDYGPMDCIDCIQACESCNPSTSVSTAPQVTSVSSRPSPSQMLRKMARNFNSHEVEDKITTKQQIFSQTLPRNFSYRQSNDEPYVIVVSDLQNTTSKSNLTVLTSVKNESSGELITPTSSMSSAQQTQVLKIISSDDRKTVGQFNLDSDQSSSESGRGTLTSEWDARGADSRQNVLNIERSSPVDEPPYASVCKERKCKKSESEKVICAARGDVDKKETSSGNYHRTRYSQLYTASSRAPMPAVVETESFASDCSTFREVVSRGSTMRHRKQQQQTVSEDELPVSGGDRRSVDKKTSSTTMDRTVGGCGRVVSRKGVEEGLKYRSSRRTSAGDQYSSDSVDCPSNDDDKTMDNVDDCESVCTAEISVVGKQRKLKEHIIGIQSTYEDLMKRLSTGKDGHRRLSSEDTTSLSHRKSVPSLSASSRSTKFLEDKITTLTHTVAHLSNQVNEISILRDEMAKWRKECTSLTGRVSVLQDKLDSLSSVKSTDHTADKAYSTVKKSNKMSKLSSKENSALRLFLRSLSCEEYTLNFEKEKIGFDELVFLSEDKLAKLKIPHKPRVKIHNEIQKMRLYGTRSRKIHI